MDGARCHITEGSVRLCMPARAKVDKKMPVFYNPAMKANRDISIALLRTLARKDLRVGLALAGSGIRGLRFLKELDHGMMKSISFNDINPSAIKELAGYLVLENMHFVQNRVDVVSAGEAWVRRDLGGRISLPASSEPGDTTAGQMPEIYLTCEDANVFMRVFGPFDYLDIDPFGSPNPFLDFAVRGVTRGGILAVTATDTAPLCGTYKKACLRKYWSTPSRDHLMHEVGLRILIRKVQLIGAQYDKALIPAYSYSKDHYFRVFFRLQNGKAAVDEVLAMHGIFHDCGPMWLGDLWDMDIAKGICDNLSDEQNKGFTRAIADESSICSVGFHNIHMLAKKHKFNIMPRIEEILLEIRKKCPAQRTHFSPYGIRTEMGEDELTQILISFQKV